MTPQMNALQDYLQRATTVYRKGDVVSFEPRGSHVDVVVIDAFPALPEGLTTTIDCHYVHVGFTEALAELSHQEFYDLVASATEGVFQYMHISDWSSGPSYISIGAWLGDQTLAFQFMACVQAHGLGKVITPASLGVTGERGEAMAGAGYVLLSGLNEPVVTFREGGEE